MDAYEAIMTRRSIADLVGPPPSRGRMERLLDAAVMAPNHHLTEPWRFIVLTGDALTDLGAAFAASAAAMGRNVEAARRLATRAPAVVVVIDRAGNHHHVPASDEHYAVGAAMQNLLLAAHADGLGAMIRTGPHVGAPSVRELLGVKPDETIAGFVYLGALAGGGQPPAPPRTPAAERTEWRGSPLG